MKRTWVAVLVGAVLISLVGLGIQQISASSSDAPRSSIDGAQLTSTEVREIVEGKYPGEITELELERENGQLVYEVEVEGAEGEYEVKLDATTGQVVKLEEKPTGKSESPVNEPDRTKENVHTSENGQTSADEARESKPASDKKNIGEALISIEEARDIALREVPGTIEEIELDREDGLLIYEVEIETETGEAEVEVNALTGEIILLSWDD